MKTIKLSYEISAPEFLKFAYTNLPMTECNEEESLFKVIKSDQVPSFYKILNSGCSMNTNISKWYLSTFGEHGIIKTGMTFENLYMELLFSKRTIDIYSIVRDSIDRERVFSQLAYLLDVEYSRIYDLYLNGQNIFELW